MKALKKYSILLSLCLLLVFALQVRNAIGLSANILHERVGSSSSSSSSTSNSKSPADVLRASALAMLQLKTLHVTIAHTKVQSVSLSDTNPSSSPTSGTVTVTTNYDADEQLPDQASAEITINAQSSDSSMGPGNIQIAEVVQGIQIYLQPPNGGQSSSGEQSSTGQQSSSGPQWLVFGPPSSINPGLRRLLLVLPVNDYINMLAMLVPFTPDSDITDDGTENVQGTNLHHFTVTLGPNVLQGLIDLDMADDTYTPEAQSLTSATLEVWLDDSTSYVHNMTLAVNTSEDFSKLMPKSSSSSSASSVSFSSLSVPTGTITTAVNLSVAFSQFNQAVSISTPPNAVPTSNLPQSLTSNGNA